MNGMATVKEQSGYDRCREGYIADQRAKRQAIPKNDPILKFDDGRDVFLDSFSGGANPDGELSHLVLRIVGADGTEERRSYTADRVLEGA